MKGVAIRDNVIIVFRCTIINSYERLVRLLIENLTFVSFMTKIKKFNKY